MRTLEITLPDDIVEDLEAAVAAGEFSSIAAAVEAALENLVPREWEPEALEAALTPGLADLAAGRFSGVSLDEIWEAMLARRALRG